MADNVRLIMDKYGVIPVKLLDSTILFRQAMEDELHKHNDEKFSLDSYDASDVFLLTVHNIEDRLHNIKNFGPEIMEKECIHIANYCMFLWMKLQELKK